MAADGNASPRGDKFFGVAGPAVLGAVAGAAIGNVLGIAAAVGIALVCVVLLRGWRASKAC